MGRHYSTRDFFRQMPNGLLARYFEAQGVLAELDFAAMKEIRIDELFAAWLELPEGKRNEIDADFSEIHALGCEKGWCAIRDEAEFQFRQEPDAFTAFVERMGDLDGHFERAMVTFLDFPSQFWKNAMYFHHADTLPWWRKRKGLPNLPASVHEDGRQALANSIGDYFHRTEGRGKNCMVEALRRGELDYFFAYPEDYSQQRIEWIDGKFDRRQHKPAFEVIYLYSQKDGTLDVNCRGANKAVESLQAMFATAILKLSELPPDPTDKRVYDLNPLRERSFQFISDPASGIQSVAVKKIRLSSKVARGERITLEADIASNREAIYDLLDKVGRSVQLRLYNVTQVEVAAKVTLKADEKPKSVTVTITHPNSCSLKYDDTDLRLRKLLVDSGIELREPTESTELAWAEAVEA